AQKIAGKLFNCCVAVQRNGVNITIHLVFNKMCLNLEIKVIQITLYSVKLSGLLGNQFTLNKLISFIISCKWGNSLF
uniref:hypothetical protein n=1 Tax=Yersinia aleksiciae TaxID=263819 RepID=UPI001C944620